MNRIRIKDDFEIEYFEYGTGKNFLISFHGYGRNASEFKGLESIIGSSYKIVAVNLPFHGNSICLQQTSLPTFDKSHLEALINGLIDRYEISRFSLLGYSLGGRVALCCIELFSEKIEKAFLFAPDGVKMSQWYRFSSGTAVGRSILRQLVRFPFLFFATAKAMKNLKLLRERKYHFIHQQMETAEKRRDVYNVWVVFRKLIIDLNHLDLSVIKLFIFFGKYDSIIPTYFAKKLNKTTHPDAINILNTGHNISVEVMGNIIRDK